MRAVHRLHSFKKGNYQPDSRTWLTSTCIQSLCISQISAMSWSGSKAPNTVLPAVATTQKGVRPWDDKSCIVPTIWWSPLFFRRWVIFESCATPPTTAHQTPLARGSPRQEHWSGLPCPPPGAAPTRDWARASCIDGGISLLTDRGGPWLGTLGA